MSFYPSLASYLSLRSEQIRSTVSYALGAIDALLLHPATTEEDKCILNSIKDKFLSKEISDIILDHANGKVTPETLDKMERVVVEVIDKVIEKKHQGPIIEIFEKVMNRQVVREARIGYEQGLQRLSNDQ